MINYKEKINIVNEFEHNLYNKQKYNDNIEKILQHNKKLSKYKEKVGKLIKEKINLKQKEFKYEPTIFGKNNSEYIKLLKYAFKVRQNQMKEGEIAQIAIGNFCNWKNLKMGHESGLDCKKKDNSIIMEIKNKYNTCNSNSQKTMLDKLAKYKEKNPYTKCVWGIVNPKPNCNKLKEKIIHNGFEIEKIQGEELFKLVFNIDDIDYSQEIVNFIKNTVHKLT